MNAADFRAAMRSAGLTPPETIEPGRFQRFPGLHKRNGNTAGYCKMFDDGHGGVFGDFSTGYSEIWQAYRQDWRTPAECEAVQRKVEEGKVRADAERKAEHAKAAAVALERWRQTQTAEETHPYLVGKGVQPYGIRQDGD